MAKTVIFHGLDAIPATTADIVGHGQCGPSVQENLQDLVVVFVGCQKQWGDFGCEGRDVAIDFFPTLKVEPSLYLVLQENIKYIIIM